MREEITEAATFVRKFFTRNVSIPSEQGDKFQNYLERSLERKYKGHWYPSEPDRGQAFRCLRWNAISRKEDSSFEAAVFAGINYEDLSIPLEFTIWIDPGDVSVRFGEEGSCESLKNTKSVYEKSASDPTSNSQIQKDEEPQVNSLYYQKILNSSQIKDKSILGTTVPEENNSHSYVYSQSTSGNATPEFTPRVSQRSAPDPVLDNSIPSHDPQKLRKTFSGTELSRTVSSNSLPNHVNENMGLSQADNLIRLQRALTNNNLNELKYHSMLDYNLNVLIPSINKSVH